MAAPEILDLGASSKNEVRAHLKWAQRTLPPIPASAASIDDAWDAGGGEVVLLIQDAHTNESAQLNEAALLDALYARAGDLSSYVYLEAGSGDESLSFLRRYAPQDVRRRVAKSFLLQAKLQGTEYLDLTSEYPMTLYGVEDMQLYAQSVALYRLAAAERQKFLLHLDRIQSTVEALKPDCLNPILLSFDRVYQKRQKGEIPLTEYFRTLARYAETLQIASEYPHLKLLRKLNELEEKIDFDKAAEEEAKALSSLSEEEQGEARRAISEPSRLNGKHQSAFFAYLDARIKDKKAYPMLARYLEYLRSADELNSRELLAEQTRLENDIFGALTAGADEAAMLKAGRSADALKKLLALQCSPEEYEAYRKDKADFDVRAITGFLNKKIMDAGDRYDKALFLEDGYEEAVRRCEQFYELTYARDEAFLKNMERAGDGKPMKVLVAGGYHAPNLKYLLRKKNISYISIAPRVLQETNLRRYEDILLGRSQPGQAGFGALARHSGNMTTRTFFNGGLPELAAALDLTESQTTAAYEIAASRLANVRTAGAQPAAARMASAQSPAVYLKSRIHMRSAYHILSETEMLEKLEDLKVFFRHIAPSGALESERHEMGILNLTLQSPRLQAGAGLVIVAESSTIPEPVLNRIAGYVAAVLDAYVDFNASGAPEESSQIRLDELRVSFFGDLDALGFDIDPAAGARLAQNDTSVFRRRVSGNILKAGMQNGVFSVSLADLSAYLKGSVDGQRYEVHYANAFALLKDLVPDLSRMGVRRIYLNGMLYPVSEISKLIHTVPHAGEHFFKSGRATIRVHNYATSRTDITLPSGGTLVLTDREGNSFSPPTMMRFNPLHSADPASVRVSGLDPQRTESPDLDREFEELVKAAAAAGVGIDFTVDFIPWFSSDSVDETNYKRFFYRELPEHLNRQYRETSGDGRSLWVQNLVRISPGWFAVELPEEGSDDKEKTTRVILVKHLEGTNVDQAIPNPYHPDNRAYYRKVFTRFFKMGVYSFRVDLGHLLLKKNTRGYFQEVGWLNGQTGETLEAWIGRSGMKYDAASNPDGIKDGESFDSWWSRQKDIWDETLGIIHRGTAQTPELVFETYLDSDQNEILAITPAAVYYKGLFSRITAFLAQNKDDSSAQSFREIIDFMVEMGPFLWGFLSNFDQNAIVNFLKKFGWDEKTLHSFLAMAVAAQSIGAVIMIDEPEWYGLSGRLLKTAGGNNPADFESFHPFIAAGRRRELQDRLAFVQADDGVPRIGDKRMLTQSPMAQVLAQFPSGFLESEIIDYKYLDNSFDKRFLTFAFETKEHDWYVVAIDMKPKSKRESSPAKEKNLLQVKLPVSAFPLSVPAEALDSQLNRIPGAENFATAWVGANSSDSYLVGLSYNWETGHWSEGDPGLPVRVIKIGAVIPKTRAPAPEEGDLHARSLEALTKFRTHQLYNFLAREIADPNRNEENQSEKRKALLASMLYPDYWVRGYAANTAAFRVRREGARPQVYFSPELLDRHSRDPLISIGHYDGWNPVQKYGMAFGELEKRHARRNKRYAIIWTISHLVTEWSSDAERIRFRRAFRNKLSRLLESQADAWTPERDLELHRIADEGFDRYMIGDPSPLNLLELMRLVRLRSFREEKLKAANSKYEDPKAWVIREVNFILDAQTDLRLRQIVDKPEASAARLAFSSEPLEFRSARPRRLGMAAFLLGVYDGQKSRVDRPGSRIALGEAVFHLEARSEPKRTRLILRHGNKIVYSIGNVSRAAEIMNRLSASRIKTLKRSGMASLLKAARANLAELLPPADHAEALGAVEIDLSQLAESLLAARVPPEEALEAVNMLLSQAARQRGRFFISHTDEAYFKQWKGFSIDEAVARARLKNALITTIRPQGLAIAKLHFDTGAEQISVSLGRGEVAAHVSGFMNGQVPDFAADLRIAQEAAEFYGKHLEDGEISSDTAAIVADLERSALLKALRSLSVDGKTLKAAAAHELMRSRLMDRQQLRLILIRPLLQFLSDRMSALRYMKQAEAAA